MTDSDQPLNRCRSRYTTTAIALMLEKLPIRRGRCARSRRSRDCRRASCEESLGVITTEKVLGWNRTYGGAMLVTRRPKRGAVPVIPRLRKVLDAYRAEFPPRDEDDFIFRGEKKGFALDLHNLSQRVIKPLIGDLWAGWHGFHRGLATRLYYMGTEAKTVRAILRHANVSTTMAHYVLADPSEQRSAMAKLDGVLDSIWSQKQGGSKRKKAK